MMGHISIIKDALWFILPAYVANGMPVLTPKLFSVRHPIDGGRLFVDGERILGDNKTWEGFVLGFFSALIVGLLQSAIDGATAILRGAVLGFGALLGDCIGAFIKRRMKLKPGAPAPLLDQLTFLVFALLLAYITGFYTIGLRETVFLLIATPPIHLLTNVLSYLLKIKGVPW